MMLLLVMGLHVDYGEDVDDDIDDDVACFQLCRVLLLMVVVDVDDGTGTSRLDYQG